MKRFEWMLLAALVGCAGGDVDDTAIDDTDPVDTDEPGDTDDTDPPDGLAIAGSWTDEWGTVHEIDDTTWGQTFPNDDHDLYHIAGYDNDGRWVVAQNDADNAFNPELYSRFDWHVDGEAYWYCQTVFDAASEDEARSATPADPSDLDGGCGGFSWTALTP